MVRLFKNGDKDKKVLNVITQLELIEIMKEDSKSTILGAIKIALHQRFFQGRIKSKLIHCPHMILDVNSNLHERIHETNGMHMNKYGRTGHSLFMT